MTFNTRHQPMTLLLVAITLSVATPALAQDSRQDDLKKKTSHTRAQELARYKALLEEPEVAPVAPVALIDANAKAHTQANTQASTQASATQNTHQKQPYDPTGSLMLLLVGTGLICVGSFGVYRFQNRSGSAKLKDRNLKHLKTLRLGTKHQISVVSVYGATYVLGLSEGHIQVIDTLDPKKAPKPVHAYMAPEPKRYAHALKKHEPSPLSPALNTQSAVSTAPAQEKAQRPQASAPSDIKSTENKNTENKNTEPARRRAARAAAKYAQTSSSQEQESMPTPAPKKEEEMFPSISNEEQNTADQTGFAKSLSGVWSAMFDRVQVADSSDVLPVHDGLFEEFEAPLDTQLDPALMEDSEPKQNKRPPRQKSMSAKLRQRQRRSPETQSELHRRDSSLESDSVLIALRSFKEQAEAEA